MFGSKLLIFIALLSYYAAFAQVDTLRINLKDAEKLFLEHNFTLIAQKYNIDASKALIQQAKLWDNPLLMTYQNLYDHTRKFFNHANQGGEIYAQIQQVFRTARKRGIQIQLAKDHTQIQEAGFNDLMRNLKYGITVHFYELDALLEQDRIYENEIQATTHLLQAMEVQYQAGNISLKENIRLQALLFALKSDNHAIRSQINDAQSALKILLGLDQFLFIKPMDIVKQHAGI